MAQMLTDADRQRISAAVERAEALSAGEIVTIITDRSDSYTDVALAWSALVAFAAIAALAVAPDFYLGLVDRVTGTWAREWTPRHVLELAGTVATIKFIAMMLLQQWQPLKFRLIPRAIIARRCRRRAVTCFRIGAERRTTGRTGILIYLSMREHRAEIVADAAIAARVSPEVWGDAMHVMITHIKQGRMADGMIAAIGKVGAVLAAHFPRGTDDVNELPDRLIEV